jgi:hypothetical protein
MKTFVLSFEELRARNGFRDTLSDSGPDNAMIVIRKFLHCEREDIPDFGATLHLLNNIFQMNKN